MEKINYQKILDKKLSIIEKEQKVPSLLLHSCCAPCSSYVLEYLTKYFNITLFYYNPNIQPKEEYLKRVNEQISFINNFNNINKVDFLEGLYDTDTFIQLSKGLEKEKEGGTRCFKCYELRLKKTAEKAKELEFDYFTTTLTISPHKNAAKLNEIGEFYSKLYEVEFLNSDFKKKNGYKRSIELSNEFNLYRQDYCGCVFSKLNR